MNQKLSYIRVKYVNIHSFSIRVNDGFLKFGKMIVSISFEVGEMRFACMIA